MWSCLPIFSLAIKILYFHIFASYTITFAGKSICFSLIWSDNFFMCKYLYIFASLFHFMYWRDTSILSHASIPNLLFFVNIFLTLLNDLFFQKNFTSPLWARWLFHLEVTTVLTLKKNLTIAYIGHGSTTQKVCDFKL